MLAFHPYPVQFAANKLVRHLPVGSFADDDAGAILLGHAFEARGQIDVVAHHRPRQPLGRSHVSDVHRAGVETDSDGDLLPPFRYPFYIEFSRP